MTLEETRRPVGQPPAAKVGMNRERAEVRDPAAPVRDLESHHPGAAPLAATVDLDEKAAKLLRLRLRALDLGQEPLAVARPDHRQVRLDLLVAHQLDEEVEIGRLGPAESETVCSLLPVLLDHCGAGAGSRRRAVRTSPEPSPTPARISTSPRISSTVMGSPSSPAP